MRRSGSIPNTPSPTNSRSAYHDKGDNDRAIADYSEAIRLDPKSMGAYSLFPLLGGLFVFTALIGLGYCGKWGDGRIAFALFLILWTTYASIGPGDTAGNSNVVTRMGLVYAIIDNHSVTIDAFAPFTDDKANYGGHYYLDKAPGLSLTALPAVGVFLFGLRALDISAAPIVSGELTTSYYAAVWLASSATSALFTAAAAVALYFLSRYCHASRTAALFGALVFGLATPATGWATTFFSHATAGACLFIAFALMILASDANGSGRRDFAAGLLTGALLAWSVVVEFTAAPAVLAIAGFGFYRLLLLPLGRSKKLVLAAVIGGALAALPLAFYDAIAFGSVFHVGYQNVVSFEGMNKGFFGISLPRLDVLWEIIFGAVSWHSLDLPPPDLRAFYLLDRLSPSADSHCIGVDHGANDLFSDQQWLFLLGRRILNWSPSCDARTRVYLSGICAIVGCRGVCRPCGTVDPGGSQRSPLADLRQHFDDFTRNVFDATI